MAALVEEFFTRSLAEVHRYEGTVTQFLGDGFLALFGAPLAHEDHAHRAVLAAWDIAATLRDEPITIRGSERPVRVRMGLNSGEVVVGRIGDSLRMDYTAIGDTINLASRLQAVAEPGGIVLSESTFRAAGRSIEAEPLGERLVKGRSEPVVVHRLVRVRGLGRPGAAGRGLRPAAGRPGARGGGARGPRRAPASRPGLPGAGERRGRRGEVAPGRRGPRPPGFRAGAVARGAHALVRPGDRLLALPRGAAGPLRDPGGRRRAREPRPSSRRRCGPSSGTTRPRCFPTWRSLLGLEVTGELAERVRYLDGGAMGPQILLSVRRLFERLAREGPVALVIEDLHWIDESSTELIEHLLPLVREVPLLIVCVSRPDGEGPLERLRALRRGRPSGGPHRDRPRPALPRGERGAAAGPPGSRGGRRTPRVGAPARARRGEPVLPRGDRPVARGEGR